MGVRVFFYASASGRSPVEKFIEGLSKRDQARFAEVKQGIENHGFDYARAECKPLKGKLWELKFKALKRMKEVLA